MYKLSVNYGGYLTLYVLLQKLFLNLINMFIKYVCITVQKQITHLHSLQSLVSRETKNTLKNFKIIVSRETIGVS